MADYEVSKLMWIAIVVALAASIFTIAKPEIKTAADDVFNKVEEVVKGIDTDDSDKPDPNAKHWDVTGATNDFVGITAPTGDLIAGGKVVGKYQVIPAADGQPGQIKYAFAEEAAKDVDLSKPLTVTLSAGDVQLAVNSAGEGQGPITSIKGDYGVKQVDDNGKTKAMYDIVFEFDKDTGSIKFTAPKGGHSIYGITGSSTLRGETLSATGGYDFNVDYVEK